MHVVAKHMLIFVHITLKVACSICQREILGKDDVALNFRSLKMYRVHQGRFRFLILQQCISLVLFICVLILSSATWVISEKNSSLNTVHLDGEYSRFGIKAKQRGL